MKLLIAIPSLDYMDARFVECLVKLTKKLSDDGIDYEVKIQTGTLVHVGRDKLCRYAMGNKHFTHVLWLDADMIFNEDLVDDLMDSGKSFVSGIAHGRRPPYFSCLFKDIDLIIRFTEYPATTFEVAGCGMACVLMEVDVIRKVWENYKTCFLPMASAGEDLAFCKRATACGIKIWAEPSVKVGHIGHEIIWPYTTEEWKKGVYGYGV